MKVTDVVNRIELKIRSIKERLNFLQSENKMLSEQITVLSEILLEKDALIAQYEQDKYIDNTTKNNNGSEKAKQKIEEMMREIDKCIALLK